MNKLSESSLSELQVSLDYLQNAYDYSDSINSLHGDEDCLCLFCKSLKYNSEVGIIHSDDCYIFLLRKTISNLEDWINCYEN